MLMDQCIQFVSSPEKNARSSCLALSNMLFEVHVLVLLLSSLPLAFSEDNGLARLPPMGWSSWNAQHSGQISLNEATIRRQADALVSSGLAAAGYRYINIDDYWSQGRDASGSLLASAKAFPSGMKALADYVHTKSLYLGLYTDVGTRTCGGAPGSYGFECDDARTFSSWGVDWLKEDHCSLPPGNPWPPKRDGDRNITTRNVSTDTFYRSALTRMSQCLNATGRQIGFGVCAHACYDVIGGVDQKHNASCWRQWYELAGAIGNTWRTTTDIAVSGGGPRMWASVLNNELVPERPLRGHAAPGLVRRARALERP